jgi:hypothetical protein
MSQSIFDNRTNSSGDAESLVFDAARGHRRKVIKRTARAASEGLSFYDWATEHYYIVDKWQRYVEHPITFVNHPYLEEIYRDEADKLVIMKGAQVGMSEMCIARAFYWTGLLKYITAYYFPTRDSLESYSHARIDTVIERSAELKDLVTNPDVSKLKGIKPTMNVKLKEVNGRFIYFQGAQKRSQMLAVDADGIILDEFDEFSDEAVAAIQQRLAGSPAKKELNLSTPKYPNRGIHEAFKETDQRVYELRCERCGRWAALEFPKSLMRDSGGRWYFGCVFCGREIDRFARDPDHARWVATAAENRDIHGYHVPGLLSPGRSAESIMREGQKAEERGGARLSEFNWSVLGIPYAPKGSQLTAEALDACIARGAADAENPAYKIPVGTATAAVMGVDVGRVLHVEIDEVPLGRGTSPYTKPRLVFAGEIGTGNFDSAELDELNRLMGQYKVRLAIIDAQPETRFAMDFVKKWRGRARAVRWNSTQKEHIVEGKDRQITVNKTICYDDRTRQIDTRGLLLPTNIRSVPVFYDQTLAPIRMRDEKDDGTVVYVYDSSGRADHYGDAGAYATLAYVMIGERARRSSVLEYDKEIERFFGTGGFQTAEVHAEVEKDAAKTEAVAKAAAGEFVVDEMETKAKEIEKAQRTLAAFNKWIKDPKGP